MVQGLSKRNFSFWFIFVFVIVSSRVPLKMWSYYEYMNEFHHKSLPTYYISLSFFLWLLPEPQLLLPSPWFTVFKPHWPLCWSLNEKACSHISVLVPDLPSVWNALAPDILLSYSLPSFKSLIQCGFCRKRSSDHLINNNICSPLCLSLSLTLL